MFFLIPKNVTSERPIALMLTLIRWWEAMRALEVAKGSRSTALMVTLLMAEMEELLGIFVTLRRDASWKALKKSSTRCEAQVRCTTGDQP